MYIGEISKLVERDNWEKGCIGGGSDFGVIYSLRSETLSELVQKFADFVGVEKQYVEYDEYNRDFLTGKTENDDGFDPTEKELKDWKNGKIDLWLADYFLSVKQTVEVSSEDMQAALV